MTVSRIKGRKTSDPKRGDRAAFIRAGKLLAGLDERVLPDTDWPRRSPVPPLGCQWARGYLPIAHFQDNGHMGEKGVRAMCTLSVSDWTVQPSDWPGFRMFPTHPSDGKPWNPVRVPPRAWQTLSSEEVFAFDVCTFWLVRSHSRWPRGVPGAAGRLCGCGGVGSGSWLTGPPMALYWPVGSSLSSGRSWLSHTSSWVGSLVTT
ncbi:hypothetical protein ABIA52_002271 [Paenarthrobacter histidinolovorans]|uniref:Uncharacterized protein n=1 Tax=Paenarthrobacter histidinolovorans TaxID=43664 RepID=A0ABW8N720_9MICC